MKRSILSHPQIARKEARAFTIVELVVIIAVIGILVTVGYFGFSTWRDRVAETELKSDLNAVAAAMESARNWGKGFPELSDGATFDGSDPATKDLFTQSSNVILTYYEGDGKNFCIDAVSKARSTVTMFYNTENGNKEPKKGTCLGGEGSSINGTQTVFVFDTRLSDCSGTIQLPIASPTSAPGSTINWGDGSTSSLTAGLQSHAYSTPGRYVVTYDGPIANLSHGALPASVHGCMRELRQWGSAATPWSVSFHNAKNLTYVAKPPSTVTQMPNLFNGAVSFNQPIGDWDVSNVVNMNSAFMGATLFNQPIGTWNVGSVTDMFNMFLGATSFNQNLNSWNVSNVTTMTQMFYGATAFNSPIGSWNTSKVTNMGGMFTAASNFNQPIGSWNVSSVTNMSQMFLSSAFNQPVGSWNVGNVANMGGLFRSSPFNQPIGSWNTSNATNMNSMFAGATAFNQPISSWNTGNVTDMGQMFYNAVSFNQNLSGWNVSKVTPRPPGGFNADTPAWTLPKPTW